MKHLKLYEKFEDDLEEVWEEEPDLEIDFSKIVLGYNGPEFKVLDKVIVNNNIINNKVGYIIQYSINYLVYFVDYVGGHDGRHRDIPDGYGMWVNGKDIKKIS